MKKKITWLLAAAFTGIVVFSGVCQADGMSVDKEDGEYSIQVDLEGGSGKASVTSPTILTVEDGKAYAQILAGACVLSGIIYFIRKTTRTSNERK